ncbi:MAG: ribonucleoside-diphosphate reductase subunit alpha [Firmicutes bacterium]|nr:ribonucleoside-diphosphate reductase subunit alpha [Bacillota bacterium]
MDAKDSRSLQEAWLQAIHAQLPECTAEDCKALLSDARALFLPNDDEAALWRALAQVAAERTSVDQPQWTFWAARLFLEALFCEAAPLRGGRRGYGDFLTHVQAWTAAGCYHPVILQTYSPEELIALGQAMVPERDRLFTYAGLHTLADRYLIHDPAGKAWELPQEAWMGVAAYLALHEQDRVLWAKRFYDVMSTLCLLPATPTLANARRPRAQLASCFIDAVEDDLASIYRSNAAFAQVSKNGGGMGIYLGSVRGRGAAIRGQQGVAAGVVPWVRCFDETTIAVDQLGMRKGAVTVTLDIWHPDIEAFLELKTNNGDPRLKAHDVFTSVAIPDLFMRTVAERGDWYLFDPDEVRRRFGWSLEMFFGEAFEAHYRRCIAAPNLPRRVLPAIDLMKALLKSAYETGTPFLFFRDTVQRDNPNKHAGQIYASNLCTEIAQNTSPTREIGTQASVEGTITTRLASGDFVVCNLASINLGKITDPQALSHVVKVAVRMLDNVIDLNAYPLPQAKLTAQRYRAVGLGVMGYHQYLAQRGIPWESEAHLQEAERLFAQLAFEAIDASCDLAKARGSYPLFGGSEWQSGAYFERHGYVDARWQSLRAHVRQFGLRNGYLLAVAPTSSISVIAGTTASVDPIFARFYLEEKKGEVLPQVAPGLSPENFWLYKPAHQIDQRWSIRAAAVRQRHLDQSQSINLYVTPQISAQTLLELYQLAWQEGLKTVYYLRSQSLTVDDSCESCAG